MDNTGRNKRGSKTNGVWGSSALPSSASAAISLVFLWSWQASSSLMVKLTGFGSGCKSSFGWLDFSVSVSKKLFVIFAHNYIVSLQASLLVHRPRHYLLKVFIDDVLLFKTYACIIQVAIFSTYSFKRR